MATLLLYILESTVCLTLLYVLYRLFFKADTLFRTNRFLLLAGTVCCLLLPLVQVEVAKEQLWQQPISMVRHWLSSETSAAELLEAEDTALISEASDSFNLSYPHLLAAIYGLGALVVFFFFFRSLHQVRRLLNSYPYTYCNGHWLVVCPEQNVSFSWRDVVVLSQEDYERHRDEVLLHEEMHLRYKHSLDLFWMQFLLIFHWFNPAVWAILRELRELHEFEADNGVLAHGVNPMRYQLLLVRRSVNSSLYSMTSGFAVNTLKLRISMMLRQRTSGWARLKMALWVPVVVLTLFAFATPKSHEPETAVPIYQLLAEGGSEVELPIPVEVDLKSSAGLTISFRNCSLKELEQGINAYRSVDKAEMLSISLRIGSGATLGNVRDVKTLLANYYQLTTEQKPS